MRFKSLLIPSIFLMSACYAGPDDLRRVEAFLTLGDSKGAYRELQGAIARQPYDLDLKKLEIKVLARQGNEKKMLEQWNSVLVQYPDLLKDRQLIEEMAWGVIDKGALSGSPHTRCIALIASAISNSAHGVAKMKSALSDQNTVVRLVGVELAGKMRDEVLRKEVVRLMHSDKVWRVRVEAIRSVGRMKIATAREELEGIIASPTSMAEEKAAATESLVALLEGADRLEVERLTSSPRAGLRLLGAEVIAKLDLQRDTDLLIKLSNDSIAEVRLAALQGLAIVAQKDSRALEVARIRMGDRDPKVAVTAAWLAALNGAPEGFRNLKEATYHESRPVRIYASAALAATGSKVLKEKISLLRDNPDPFVKANLAVGLIRQREAVNLAAQVLDEVMQREPGLWMQEQTGVLQALSPNTLKHKEGIPQYPEAVDRMVRLQTLQLLTYVDYPGTRNAVRNFLRDRDFGVSIGAMTLLLTEGGDKVATEVISPLLEDEDIRIRVQAALILAVWGKEEAVLAKLEAAYPAAHRDLKEHILEGMGAVGSYTSIPFLIGKFGESHQNLRLIAAAATLQSLYH